MDEKKSRYTEAQKKSAEKYLKNFDDIKLRVIHGERDIMKNYATSHGWNSLNDCFTSVMTLIMKINLTADEVSEALINAKKLKE